GEERRPYRGRPQRHSAGALPRYGPIPPGIREWRGRRHGRAPRRRAAGGLHPLVRGRSESALSRGRHGDATGGGRGRDHAVVLGGNGDGPAPAASARPPRRLVGPRRQGRRLRDRAMTTDRDQWLAQVKEDILEPDLPICDPHHHLWDHPGRRYLIDELIADTGSGHNVTSTV